MERSTVTAFLGPTNTGKTHRAVLRMLEHDTGAIGLPLRLLAREVYDKVREKVGAERVALVTGEERRVPRAPSYWISTTEAMDTERPVDFVAVDEVQLMEDRERGHVFTDRVLHARGRRETIFLGSLAARDVLLGLVPHAVLEHAPRLSRLSHAGALSLKKLPPRSAVVAFSMAEVVELAERAKVRGGAAVVLGALSPRARNAQVAMFQAGEVDTLVATDAIGMGLNLDCRHVAFAKLRKFDGREVRELEVSEASQIAGRAGRYVTDGTFGTLAPLSLPTGLVRSVEQHLVPSIRRARFRARPSFDSLDALVASLTERGRSAWLVQAPSEVDDLRTLASLAARPEVRRRVTSEDDVRLLWEMCSIPDYRKLLFESHAAFVLDLFVEVRDRGPVSHAFLASRFAGVSDTTGDVDTLLARIAHVRLLSYIAQKARFVAEPSEVAGRAAVWEDQLSDALHAALVARFVTTGKRRVVPMTRAPSRGRERVPEPPPSHTGPFAALAELRVFPSREPLARERSVVEVIDAAAFADFALGPMGEVSLHGEEVLRLVRGRTLAEPAFKLTLARDLRGGERLVVERRARAFVSDLASYFVRDLLPLPEGASAALRGIVFRLREGLGAFVRAEAKAELSALSPACRAHLARANVVTRFGTVMARTAPEDRRVRAALVHVATGERLAEPEVAWASRRAFPKGVSPLLFGYYHANGVWVRGDLAPPAANPAERLGRRADGAK
ncbi:MAG: helicase-related protein [Polyangiaceae bacterium]